MSTNNLNTKSVTKCIINGHLNKYLPFHENLHIRMYCRYVEVKFSNNTNDNFITQPRSKKEYSLSYAEAEIKQIYAAQPFSL